MGEVQELLVTGACQLYVHNVLGHNGWVNVNAIDTLDLKEKTKGIEGDKYFKLGYYFTTVRLLLEYVNERSE